MGRSAANNITQSGSTEWSKRDKSTYDPTDDIEAYALNASGVVNIIVFDPKGWALFRSFKAVKEKLDTRRGSNSELETKSEEVYRTPPDTLRTAIHDAAPRKCCQPCLPATLTPLTPLPSCRVPIAVKVKCCAASRRWASAHAAGGTLTRSS